MRRSHPGFSRTSLKMSPVTHARRPLLKLEKLVSENFISFSKEAESLRGRKEPIFHPLLAELNAGESVRETLQLVLKSREEVEGPELNVRIGKQKQNQKPYLC